MDLELVIFSCADERNIGSNEILAEKLYYTFTNYFEIAATQLKPCKEEIYFLNRRIVEVYYIWRFIYFETPIFTVI